MKRINKTFKKNNVLKGKVKKLDILFPSYINKNNPRVIEIDNLFYSGLLIVDYAREQKELILKNLIESNIDMDISIFYEKQDTYSVIRELTYQIGNVGIDIKDRNKNREDIEIATYTYNDAKYIRKEIQVNNEEMYYLYIYIEICDEEEKKLKENIEKVESILTSIGIISKRANFRQDEVFKACLPISKNSNIIKEATRRNILTSGLVGTYPFISENIFDVEGILLGTNLYNNSMIFIDRYNTEKYKNANMCIFGTSGAGKSFYTKLLIIRYRILGIKQYIIDPEREVRQEVA